MMVLVTGGAASGKSAYAEDVAIGLAGPHFYLAAMKPYGEEGARRIARHRQLRAGKGFSTVECFDGLEQAVSGVFGRADALEAHGTALLECLGNVVANELFDETGAIVAEEVALRTVLDGVRSAAGAFDNLVIVGNEVGGDGVSYDEATRSYIRVLGAASCELAQVCDTVVECVSGQPLNVKGGF